MKELDIQLNIDKEDFKKKLGIKDGKDGKQGKDGKDGSPDTPEQIVKKIESLTGENRLSVSALKDLPLFKSGAARDYSFLELTDTPNSYVANKFIKVNSAGTALEFGNDDAETDPIFSAWLATNPLSNYLYKPGIAGGQSAYGGTSSTDNLTFYSNPFQDGWVNFGTMGRIADSYGQFQIGLPALPLASSPQFLVRGHISDPATGAFASFINSDNENVLSAISYPNGLGGNTRVVLIGDTPPIADPQGRVGLVLNRDMDVGYGMIIRNGGLGDDTTANLVLMNDLSEIGDLDVPTHITLLGRTGSDWNDPDLPLKGKDMSYLYSTQGHLILGSAGTTDTDGNTYIFSGSRSTRDSIKITVRYNGNVGIGTEFPDFPLQVVGRGRFNDSIGIDTDPSTFGLDLRGSLNFVATLAPSTALTATLAGEAGNVDNGSHRYRVGFFTELGDTNLSSAFATITITDKTVDGRVNLTDIPISNDNKVIGRRIYRTKANTTSGYYLLTTLNNNTTTSLQDNVADASLTGPTYDGLDNFTRGHIYLDGRSAGFFGNTNFGLGIGSLANGEKFTGGFNFALGTGSLSKVTSGYANAALGAYSLSNVTTGYYNTAFGYYAGRSLTTGYHNTIVGNSSMVAATTASSNTAIGVNSLYKLTTGYINVAIGSGSLYSLTTGFNNVGIGFNAGYYNQTGGGNIFIGYFAGANEMGSNKLYIANSDTANPLIYGEFDNSYLKVNGDLQITGGFIRSKSIYTGTDTTDDVYLNVCDSASDFTLTVTDGATDGEEIKIVNRGTGTVTLSGKISSITATSVLYSGETISLYWDTSDDEWQ